MEQRQFEKRREENSTVTSFASRAVSPGETVSSENWRKDPLRFNKPRNGVPREFPPRGTPPRSDIPSLRGKIRGVITEANIFDPLIGDRGTRRIWNIRSERGHGLHLSASFRHVGTRWCAPATHMLCSSYHRRRGRWSPTAKFPPFSSISKWQESCFNFIVKSFLLVEKRKGGGGRRRKDNLHFSSKMRDKSRLRYFISYPFG